MLKARKKYNEELYLRKNMRQIINDMLSYMQGCETAEIFGYANEISQFCDCPWDEDFDNPSDELWKNVIGSGIFHDAFGKVVRKNKEAVVITTCY